MHTKTIIGLLVAVGILSIGGWVYRFRKPIAPPSKPSVVATIYPVYDLVRQIAGDEVIVELIVSPGIDPKSYALLPGDQEKITKAQTVFVVGRGLDAWVPSTAPIARLDKNISGEAMAYYWLSPTNAKAMIETITTELTNKNPQLKDLFLARATSYNQALDTLGQRHPEATQSATFEPYGGSINTDTYLGLMEANYQSLQ
jgi:zinc transport system substrate-binding protein